MKEQGITYEQLVKHLKDELSADSIVRHLRLYRGFPENGKIER